MKRSYTEACIDPATTTSSSTTRIKSGAGYMYEDTNYVQCARCLKSTQKPPLSLIATEWYCNNNLYLPVSYSSKSHDTNNIYHLVNAGVPQQFYNVVWQSMLIAKYSDGMSPFYYTPTTTMFPKSQMFTSFRAGKDMLVKSDVSDDECDIYLEDGNGMRRSCVLQDMFNLSDRDPTMAQLVNGDGTKIIRLGELTTRYVAKRYSYESEAFTPVSVGCKPLNLVFSHLMDSKCTESSAWFKKDFYDRIIEDPCLELNMHPDYVVRGFVDDYKTGTCDTVPYGFFGVVSDKINFLKPEPVGKGFLTLDECNRIEAARKSYDSFYEALDVEGVCVPNWEDMYRQLIIETCFQMRDKERRGLRFIMDTFNIHHSMTKWIFVPHYVLIDRDDNGTNQANNDKVNVYRKVQDLAKVNNHMTSWTKKRITAAADTMNNFHTITMVDWSSIKHQTERVSNINYRHHHIAKTGSRWGTHRIYCYDCWKEHRERIVKGIDDVNSIDGLHDTNLSVNYNFFYEMYRALPMKLRPSVVGAKCSDIEIVCQ